MGDLRGEQPPRDHADHLTAGRERRVGERAHQADGRPAVDDADAASGEQPAEVLRRRHVGRPAPGLEPQKTTNRHRLATVSHERVPGR